MTANPPVHYIDEQLSAYLEGELTQQEKDALEDHLVHCRRCREAMDELQRTRALLGSLPRQSAPSFFTSRVQGRIRRRSRGRFFSDSLLSSYRIIYLVAPIILVMLAALYILSLAGSDLVDGTTGLGVEELRQQGEGTGDAGQEPVQSTDAGEWLQPDASDGPPATPGGPNGEE
ncbi:MAG: zf-HC2 domain-containing protein [Bradymonadales bacterium]|nr:zf-HC2 domain-containing protein [Bradymonadales bacterium]